MFPSSLLPVSPLWPHSVSTDVENKGLDKSLHGSLYRPHYSNWMLLGLPCCATGRATCLNDPTWPLKPAIKQLEPKAMRPSLQGSSACAHRLLGSVCGGMQSLLIRGLVTCLCPTSFLSVSVSPGMCTGSHFSDGRCWNLVAVSLRRCYKPLDAVEDIQWQMKINK